MTPALEAARAAREAKLAAGIPLERLDPMQRAAANPTSRSLAIAAKCFDCVGGSNADGGYRRCIRECPSTRCALYAFRPYQHAEGGQRNDAQEAEAA